ncbi:PAS domain S-box protein [Leptospira kmetyi]|uniref:PAS domain S-box protein n=2 Tax=Leptospira kmetyi TaxID=408139 RepID=A0AAD0UXD7_9LEPT|nr:PAS domain S-box protein [Leptospira kmetyi]AYV57882.1 PAS domain S-box protein [Leptospira kmetyi]
MSMSQKESNRMSGKLETLEFLSGLYGESVSLSVTLSKILERISRNFSAIYGQAWIRSGSDGLILESQFVPDSIETLRSAQILPNTNLYELLSRPATESVRVVGNIDILEGLSASSILKERVFEIEILPIAFEDRTLGAFVLFIPKVQTETGATTATSATKQVASNSTEERSGAISDWIRYYGGLISEKILRRSLQESEGRMRKVLENMPILFMAVDSSFRFVSWNHECERVIGYSETEVLGREGFLQTELLKEPNASSLKMDSEIFESDFKNWELELLAKDGKTKTILLSNLSSEFSLPGWEKWFVGVDITHTKEIERELKGSLKELSDFQTALNAVSIVAFTDRAGTIIYVNQNFCNISGYSRDELLGQNHRIVNSGYHSKEFFKDLWKTISGGKIWKGEIKNKAKDGRFYWVDTTISPILDDKGKPYQYLAIRNDITERKETEEKARHAENNLKTLQDRMSPHFLFNTLSIIHSYLQTNSELADSAILMLADNYRFLTDQANKPLVPFDVEWEFMENYLKLLKLRFSDFIDVKIEKVGNFGKCQLPPLTLQPIVENSYLHGLRNKKGRGTIHVQAFIEGSKTHILIRDDGVGLKSETIHSRTLANISDRLKFYLYDSEVKMENHPDGGTIVTVTFDKPNNEKLSDVIVDGKHE